MTPASFRTRSISARVALAGPVGDHPLDLVLVVSAREVRREPLVVGELGPTHRLAEPAEDVVGVRRDHHPLVVARLEDVARRDALEVRPLWAAHDPQPVVLRHGALEHRERRLHQRDVDDLAEPAARHVAPVDRGEDPLGGEHARERVTEREVHARRRLVGEAVQVPDPAHRLRHRREPGAVRVRPGLAVAGDARQDDAGVHLAEAVVAEPPALERPRPEVLGDDVGVLDEPQEQLLARAARGG